MDVKTGHCWRCAKPLPQQAVKCSMCPLAEYCSRDCLQQDRVRHGSVDCRVFGTKRCKQCGKQDKLKECAACSNAWYCNAACQQQHWPIHKIDCKQITEYIKATGPRMGKWHSDIGGELHKTDDPPAYIGNTIAVDFLQLEGNEWSELVAVGEEELKRDYCVLSAGCGDLRSTLLTVASLPARYQGTLHVTLDDFDPFVMARNVMFLVMMVRLAARDGIASSLATIWYSVHLSRGDYNLIKETLEELTGTDAGGLSTLTLGLVSVQEADFRYLREVWEGWLVLQCQRRARASINLHQ
ncbi:uncharacterized protein LOC110988607 isoform X2 [Acanthaster planci]|uniref:Uncharacterized protein LOC110988607 isoform X2 n=1 Tax=Acanthaster planci TaxID=133434 RepID=A0A8B7ZQZ7_ACAPL|nr:uncharacterized protein LOC110988607 isoform X2 [Acanthaster planci]XP_022107998.1 uncharacterized protein LOC110988607 isoform X2 [Acanthaster planci]